MTQVTKRKDGTTCTVYSRSPSKWIYWFASLRSPSLPFSPWQGQVNSQHELSKSLSSSQFAGGTPQLPLPLPVASPANETSGHLGMVFLQQDAQEAGAFSQHCGLSYNDKILQSTSCFTVLNKKAKTHAPSYCHDVPGPPKQPAHSCLTLRLLVKGDNIHC